MANFKIHMRPGQLLERAIEIAVGIANKEKEPVDITFGKVTVVTVGVGQRVRDVWISMMHNIGLG